MALVTKIKRSDKTNLKQSVPGVHIYFIYLGLYTSSHEDTYTDTNTHTHTHTHTHTKRL